MAHIYTAEEIYDILSDLHREMNACRVAQKSIVRYIEEQRKAGTAESIIETAVNLRYADLKSQIEELRTRLDTAGSGSVPSFLHAPVVKVGRPALYDTVRLAVLEGELAGTLLWGPKNDPATDVFAVFDHDDVVRLVSSRLANNKGFTVQTVPAVVTSDDAQLSSSGAGTLQTTGSFEGWPASGLCYIMNGSAVRELVRYGARSDTTLTISAANRGLDETSEAAGDAADTLVTPALNILKNPYFAETGSDDPDGPAYWSIAGAADKWGAAGDNCWEREASGSGVGGVAGYKLQAQAALEVANHIRQLASDMVIPLEEGASYRFGFSLTQAGTGGVQVCVGGLSNTGTARTTTGTYVETITCRRDFQSEEMIFGIIPTHADFTGHVYNVWCAPSTFSNHVLYLSEEAGGTVADDKSLTVTLKER